jgi:hypothetical protein
MAQADRRNTIKDSCGVTSSPAPFPADVRVSVPRRTRIVERSAPNRETGTSIAGLATGITVPEPGLVLSLAVGRGRTHLEHPSREETKTAAGGLIEPHIISV